MATVSDILERKGPFVATVEPKATAAEAARQMSEARIGAVVVSEGDKVVGIFTERDVLAKVVARGLDPATTPVDEVMSKPVTCAEADTPLEVVKAAFTDKRLRHMPVVSDGKLAGIVTSGDVTAWEVRDNRETIDLLYKFIHSW
jgi:CBS domain-containing protein